MKIFYSYGIAVCAAVLVAGGCSGGGSASLGPSGSSEPAGMQAGAQPLGRVDGRLLLVKPQVHRDRHKSWRSPKLKSAVGGKLLFVSDFGTDDVTVYQLPKMTLVATLTGFANWPQGMCSDTGGHVWITVAHANAIYEYDNTATLVNTISDPDGWPVNCAWDKKTGNLAVANIANNNGYGGELLVYPSNGTGTPTAYVDPNVTYYYDVAYDNKSNLVATGDYYISSPYTNLYEMTTLPNGASALSTMTINGGMPFAPGGLLWDNQTKQYFAGDQECGGNFLPETSCTYTVSVTGTSATITGKITLNSSAGTPACDMTQTVRMGDKLYGGDYEYPPFIYGTKLYEDCPGGTSFTPSAAYRWILPSGGNPTKSTTSSISAPSGVAVSNL